jgi:alginate O-acetyltransferase complex protein AlgJ
VMGARPAEVDNRRLAEFPPLSAGWGFFGGLNTWATDHLPFRGSGIRAADGISRHVFGEAPRFEQPAAPVAGPVSPGPTTPAVPADPADPVESGPPPGSGYARVLEGTDGWLYMGFDVQGKCLPARPLDEVIASLRRLRSAIESSGRSFVLVVAPDKTTIVPDHLPESYVGKNCATEAGVAFWRRITREAGAIDLRGQLMAIGEQGRPAYYPLDTHWDDRGALLMTRRIAERIQPGVTASWSVTPEHATKAPADLPRLIGRTGDNEVLRYSLAPDGRHDGTRRVDTDLRQPVSTRATLRDGMIGKPVMMLADSFTVSAMRYLPAAFADIDAVFYASLHSNPDQVLDLLVQQHVVVLEVVERNLTSGRAQILDPALIDKIEAKLAANPRSR